MNIVFSLCDGKLASVSPLYVAMIFIMILSFITGLILTYNEKNKKNADTIMTSNNNNSTNTNISHSVFTVSNPINNISAVSSITNDTQLIDNTIRIETLEDDPVIDINSNIDILTVNDKSSKDQDVTITYME